MPHMNATNCPFCGVVTDVPHNTQQGCIDALHDEITRMRQLLEHVRGNGPDDADEPHPDESDPSGRA